MAADSCTVPLAEAFIRETNCVAFTDPPPNLFPTITTLIVSPEPIAAGVSSTLKSEITPDPPSAIYVVSSSGVTSSTSV